MLDKAMIEMMAQGIWDTCYMTLVSTFFGYVIGLPLGIALTLTDENGITPNRAVYRILDIIINVTRSVPFLILLIAVMPLTKLLVGKSYGSTATIVPLTLAAAPLVGRMVESSLKEVPAGVIEAALSMGAKTGTIVRKVLIGEARTSLLVGGTIVLGTVLGVLRHGGRHRRRRTGRYRHPLRLLSLRHRRHAGDAGIHRCHRAAAAGHGQSGGAEDRSQEVTGKKFRIRRKPEGAYEF